MPTTTVQIVPGPALLAQPWWSDVHRMINMAFARKDVHVFPLSWTRLDADSLLGAEGLAEELGQTGHFGVVFFDGNPVVCGGVLPFRREDWLNPMHKSDGEAIAANGEIAMKDHQVATKHNSREQTDGQHVPEWMICCFCIHPDYRRRGLGHVMLNVLVDFIKDRGARRLVANYAIEESGKYWYAMGFKHEVGPDSVVNKGYTYRPDLEPLREDVHYRMTAMELN